MQIAFEAKRAFHNGTGLGHYSRTLIESLASHFSQHGYWLLNPKAGNSFSVTGSSLQEVLPDRYLYRSLSGIWRSHWCKEWLKKNKVDLYHGLSHEIPIGMPSTGIASVVTIHDLIPERYPSQYRWIDRQIYDKKFRYACHKADRIIAISEQTKADIIRFYNIDEKKIRVCYQSCDPRFYRPIATAEIDRIRAKYQLPSHYFLSVGSVIERKNLLQICKALRLLKGQIDIPLLVIGNGGAYKRKVLAYIKEQGLGDRIRFLSDDPRLGLDSGFTRAYDFPALYQQATALLYPSYFEGFGIPVLEGLWSKIPVITSERSCLPEAGGPGAYYIDPDSAESIAAAMRSTATDKDGVRQRVQLGWEYAQRFTTEKTAQAVMSVYNELIG
ncbi:MAG: glycosyltransferase family 4 protein [Sphingomonadales bacterium]